MNSPYYNSEGYADPTAYAGTKNIIREEGEIERRASELIKVLKFIIRLSGFELIENVTQVYLHSYNIALNENHNPNLAVQCATGVTMMLANMVRQKPQNNPLEMLFAAMLSGMTQQSQGKKKPQPQRKELEKESGGGEST